MIENILLIHAEETRQSLPCSWECTSNASTLPCSSSASMPGLGPPPVVFSPWRDTGLNTRSVVFSLLFDHPLSPPSPLISRSFNPSDSCSSCPFISSQPSLSVYQTFVLEEKHGFNKTTPSLFVIDLLKSWALSIILGAPLLAAFLYVFKWAGDRFSPRLMGSMYVHTPPHSHSTPHANLPTGSRSNSSCSSSTQPSSSPCPRWP